MTATPSRSLLHPDLAIVQPVAGPAMAKVDCSAVFLIRGREMDFRRVVAVASSAARFSPAADLSVVVAFDLYRCPTRFGTAGFVPAADPFDPAGSADSGFVVVAAAAAVAADLFDCSAADPSVADFSVVAAGPDSFGSAAYLVSSGFCFAVELGKGKVVAVPSCSLTRRFSF